MRAEHPDALVANLVQDADIALACGLLQAAREVGDADPHGQAEPVPQALELLGCLHWRGAFRGRAGPLVSPTAWWGRPPPLGGGVVVDRLGFPVVAQTAKSQEQQLDTAQGKPIVAPCSCRCCSRLYRTARDQAMSATSVSVSAIVTEDGVCIECLSRPSWPLVSPTRWRGRRPSRSGGGLVRRVLRPAGPRRPRYSPLARPCRPHSGMLSAAIPACGCRPLASSTSSCAANW